MQDNLKNKTLKNDMLDLESLFLKWEHKESNWQMRNLGKIKKIATRILICYLGNNFIFLYFPPFHSPTPFKVSSIPG